MHHICTICLFKCSNQLIMSSSAPWPRLEKMLHGWQVKPCGWPQK